jgi:hypothetical protein
MAAGWEPDGDMNDLFKALKNLLHLRKIDEALALEAYLYQKFVKPKESEDHYFDCFQKWAGMFEAMGAQDRGEPSEGPGVGFILHSDSPMAHTQALAHLCELRPADAQASVFVFAKDTGLVRELFQPFGVRVYYLSREKDGVGVQIERLRTLLADNNIGILVWVSLPLWCSYAFSRRLATRQVYWSQRFHPLKSPHIDLYITPGKRTETVRNYHGQDWQVIHTPLCLEVGGVGGKAYDPPAFTPCFGTAGRTEKIEVPEFLTAVKGIVNRAGGGFLWTGKTPSQVVQDALQTIPNQFVGWVDPQAYISTLDVYLETFPLGGLCTQTAWELGVPAVALDNWHSTYGSLDYPGLLSAKSVPEYVDMAVEVAVNPELKRRTVEAQREALAAEQAQARSDVESWWALVRERVTA